MTDKQENNNSKKIFGYVLVIFSILSITSLTMVYAIPQIATSNMFSEKVWAILWNMQNDNNGLVISENNKTDYQTAINILKDMNYDVFGNDLPLTGGNASKFTP